MRAGDLIENQYGGRTLEAEFDKNKPWDDEKDIPEEIIKHVYIQRLNGPVFFGSITGFNQVMHDVPDSAKTVIIRMKRVTFMDQSGAYAMETAIKDLQAKGIEVLMTIIQPQADAILHKTHIIPTLIPENHTFKTFHECILYIKERGCTGTDIA